MDDTKSLKSEKHEDEVVELEEDTTTETKWQLGISDESGGLLKSFFKDTNVYEGGGANSIEEVHCIPPNAIQNAFYGVNEDLLADLESITLNAIVGDIDIAIEEVHSIATNAIRQDIDEDVGDSPEEIQHIAPNAIGQELDEYEVRWCQNCKQKAAEFSCTCYDILYCSRECQIEDWAEHSETCVS